MPRNFHFAVPRKGDKWIWNNVAMKNGKVTKLTRWSALPDQRNEMSMIHTFAEGEAEIQARLVLEGDYGNGPKLIAETTETFKLAKTNRPYVVDASEDDPVVTEEEIPEELRAVTIHAPRSSAESKLFPVGVDVQPPVKRVEFFVEGKRISARNTPPYATELDLGPPKPVTLRAFGYDAAGRYVDADAFVVNDNESHIGITITRLVTPDGLCHFKLSVRNPLGTRLKSVVLYAGDRKLHEWSRPPFTLSVPAASLEGVDSVRASVIDVTGCEASDRLMLSSPKSPTHS